MTSCLKIASGRTIKGECIQLQGRESFFLVQSLPFPLKCIDVFEFLVGYSIVIGWSEVKGVFPLFKVIVALLTKLHGLQAAVEGEPDETLFRVIGQAWELKDAVFRDRILQCLRQFVAGFLPILPVPLLLDVVSVGGVREAARRSPYLVQGPNNPGG